MLKFSPDKAQEIIHLALKEDVGSGDITTNGFVASSIRARGEFIACEPCVVAGLPVVRMVFAEINNRIKIIPRVNEGSRVPANTVIAEISGSARAILSGERLGLNFLQRLSGIATYTSRFVEKIKRSQTKIKDTRKTTPGLRYLEKYAVRVGGGENHRMGLYDAVLIKDNHLSLTSGSNLKESVAILRKANPKIQIEIETETLEQVQTALSANPDVIMLDNMSNNIMKKAVKMIGNKAIIEASGRMTLDRVEKVAALGVNWISVGAITASAPSIDIKLELT